VSLGDRVGWMLVVVLTFFAAAVVSGLVSLLVEEL
jgi:hypothetical protein